MTTKPITFELKKSQEGTQSTYLLYDVVGADAPQATYLYYFSFFESSQQPGDQISFSESLAFRGVYIFARVADLTAEVSDLENFFRFTLGGINSGITLAWILDLETKKAALLQVPTPFTQTPGKFKGRLTSFNFRFYNMKLKAPDAFDLVITGETQSAEIRQAVEENQIEFASSSTFLSLSNTDDKIISISFDVSTPPPDPAAYPNENNLVGGTLAFKAENWNIHKFNKIINGDNNAVWGGAIQYFYGKEGAFKKLVYPFYGPAISESQATADFNIQLDVLHLDTPQLTYFNVTDGAAAKEIFEPEGLGMFSTFGELLPIRPLKAYGYYLTRTEDKEQPFSLSPLGYFNLGFPVRKTKANLMLGLSAMEFAEITTELVIKLIPNQAALAIDFEPETIAWKEDVGPSLRLSSKTMVIQKVEDIPPLLSKQLTTSYLQLQLPTEDNHWLYFSQPLNAAYYSQSTNVQDCQFPIGDGIQIRIGQLPAVGQPAPPAIPLGLYWSVFRKNNSPNSHSADLIFSNYERQLLTPARYNKFIFLATKGNGAVFSGNDNQPLQGGRVFSTTGFVIGLNSGEKIAGTANRLLLAKSGDNYLSFNPDAATGILDPVLNVALMNAQAFIVINDWQKFSLDAVLKISGFGFNVQEIEDEAGQMINPVMIFKYANTQSLRDLIDKPSAWADPAYFIKNDNIGAVLQALDKAIMRAEDTIGKPNDPFKYFRNVILTRETWTGVIIFDCPLDGREMSPDFQMLMAGVNGPLVAHHFGVELNQLDDKSGQIDIQKSSLLGVIFYEDESVNSVTTVTEHSPAEFYEGKTRNGPLDAEEGDYKFTVQQLTVLFKNSVIDEFYAKVGLLINNLFDRPVFLKHAPGALIPLTEDPDFLNIFFIEGQYQKNGDTGKVLFTSDKEQQYEFNPRRDFVRVIDQFIIKRADLSPTGSESENDLIRVNSRFSIAGDLVFSNPIVPFNTEIPDLFSYGNEGHGLPTSGIAFNITVQLDEYGQPIQESRKTTIDMNNLAVQENKTAIRQGSLVNAMPFKLSSLLSTQNPEKNPLPGIGKEVNVVQLLSNKVTTPRYALKFELPLGSLGALAGASASIDAHMLMAWGPNDTTPDNDGATLFIQLPEASAGLLGFNLQGIVETVFGDANLMKVYLDEGEDKFVYVLLFNNVAISIMGIKLPPKVISDFVLFADPENASGGNMGWSVAATQAKEGAATSALLGAPEHKANTK